MRFQFKSMPLPYPQHTWQGGVLTQHTGISDTPLAAAFSEASLMA